MRSSKKGGDAYEIIFRPIAVRRWAELPVRRGAPERDTRTGCAGHSASQIGRVREPALTGARGTRPGAEGIPGGDGPASRQLGIRARPRASRPGTRRIIGKGGD